jgi:hypothetical protein
LLALRHGFIHTRKISFRVEPKQDPASKDWLPHAFVTWRAEGGMEHHLFADLGRTFAAKDEAVSFGFLVARTWTEKLESDGFHTKEGIPAILCGNRRQTIFLDDRAGHVERLNSRPDRIDRRRRRRIGVK